MICLIRAFEPQSVWMLIPNELLFMILEQTPLYAESQQPGDALNGK